MGPDFLSSQMRNVLKVQMEQVKDPHKTFVATVGESQQAAEVDKSWESHNQEEKKHHRKTLITYRDDNKKVRRVVWEIKSHWLQNYPS